MVAPDPAGGPARRSFWLASVGAALVLATAYATRLVPGASDADSAELQASVLLGGPVHAPGYPIYRTMAGALTAFAAAAEIPSRLNLLSLGLGLAGAWCLAAIVHRWTGSSLAAVTAMLTLGLGNVYWAHSVVAEVYVFNAALLLIALYALVRFRERGQVGWLWLAALGLGLAVAERISELSVLPAFAVLCWRGPRSVPLHRGAWPGAGLLLVAPFLFSMTFLTWEGSRATPVARDEALRRELLGEAAGPDASAAGRALATLTAARWRHATYPARPVDSARDYAGMVTGWADWKKSTGSVRLRGTALGVVGVLLALLACFVGRGGRLRLTALLLIAGNLAFFLYHRPPNHLDFTIPGMLGWCLLVGLGVAVLARRGRPGRWLATLALCIPTSLWWVNEPLLASQQSGGEVLERQSLALVDVSDTLPRDAVIVASYREGTWLRLTVQALSGRRDVQVLLCASNQTDAIVNALLDRGRTVLVESHAGQSSPGPLSSSDPLLAFGLVRVASEDS